MHVQVEVIRLPSTNWSLVQFVSRMEGWLQEFSQHFGWMCNEAGKSRNVAYRTSRLASLTCTPNWKQIWAWTSHHAWSLPRVDNMNVIFASKHPETYRAESGQEPNQSFGCTVWCQEGLFLMSAARGAALILAICFHGHDTKCSQWSHSAAQELLELSNGSAAATASQRAATAVALWLSWCFPCQHCV